MALDGAIIWICAAMSYHLFVANWWHNAIPTRYTLLVLVAMLLILTGGSDRYRSWRFNEFATMLRVVTTTWVGSLLAIIVVLFLTKSGSEFSRAWFLAWSSGTLLLMYLLRIFGFLLLRSLRTMGYNYKSLLIVGGDSASQPAQKALAEAGWSGLKLLAKVPVDGIEAWLAAQQSDPANQRASVAQRPQLDEVWLCLPLSDESGIRTALHALRHSTANIRLVPDFFSLKLINHGITEVVGVPMLDLSASPVTGSMRLFKGIEDYVLGSVILLLISPLLLAIALAIKFTSKGPVLFKQYRDGWNGQHILIYKFRTMMVHEEPDFQVTQATQNDSRITPLGAFLRRTSLDELPQFINVLQGRMSIVGPRPHAIAHNEYYKELLGGYVLRHKVKPGITGWAQVNGFRGETDTLDKMAKRVEYDLHYIEHLSIGLDLKIVFMTIFKGFVHKNAY
ncbi:undecaprenyl-phosphate glucose phosphotransferase [Rhodoferax sp.]|uniref:undecaprenyl-phosphate glucose phosphotransferase n=1 Tax=Rhodoferax sp. TaxID=50421 RepID=UPI002850B769|nr:undecaprenyl-phosphate glucose phosphotransferase [Rhodoferax sp.]MDR3368618.1 undecaprenyl-phosphate glucose phosphotransferase [Rhodoferax sp.]